jgi:hypothetical protein
MRTTTILVAAFALLLLVPGPLPRAEEADWSDLAPETQQAYLTYEDETVKRLKELVNIVERPPDDPEVGRSIYRDIFEEDNAERTTAHETAREAELRHNEGDEWTLGWVDSTFNEYRDRWSYLGTQGAVWYARVCAMHVRHEQAVAGDVYVVQFMRWFDAFATPLDAAVVLGYEALDSGGPGMIEDALVMCRAQLPIAKMLDDVWSKYEEKFSEFIEIAEEDEFADVEAWWEDWELDPEEDILFHQQREVWQECVRERYEAMREIETDAQDLMQQVVDGTFVDGEYQRIDEWFLEGDLADAMKALIRDLEKAEE